MTDNTATKGGALIRVEMIAGKLATSHPTNGVDEVATIQIFEPVLIRVMGVGTTVKVIRRRILPTLLVTSVL